MMPVVDQQTLPEGQHLYAFGQIEYADIFKEKHRTRWCYQALVDPMTNTLAIGACDGDNARYNCADAECQMP